MSVVASAPGKLVLLGEYAVMEGAEGLVVAVDRRATVRWDLADDDSLIVTAPDLAVDGALGSWSAGRFTWESSVSRQTRGRLALVERCLATLHEAGRLPSARRGGRITIATSPFRDPRSGTKLGLGSSAAVSVALAAAGTGLTGRATDLDAQRRTIFDLAFGAHRAHQGFRGSGIDVAASTWGGILGYRRGPDADPVVKQFPPGCLDPTTLVCVWTGQPADTSELVERVFAYRQGSPDDFARRMTAMADNSSQGCRALERLDRDGFLDAMREYGHRLEDLGRAASVDLLTVEHRRAMRIVEACRGVYKPSGAGGGDLGLAMARRPEDTPELTGRLAAAGFSMVPVGCSKDGVAMGG